MRPPAAAGTPAKPPATPAKPPATADTSAEPLSPALDKTFRIGLVLQALLDWLNTQVTAGAMAVKATEHRGRRRTLTAEGRDWSEGTVGHGDGRCWLRRPVRLYEFGSGMGAARFGQAAPDAVT